MENISQLVSEPNFDVAKRHPHVKNSDECKWVLEKSRVEALVTKGFPQEIVRVEGGFSASRAVLYRNSVLAVLRIRMTMGLSQNVFSRLQSARNTSGILYLLCKGKVEIEK